MTAANVPVLSPDAVRWYGDAWLTGQVSPVAAACTLRRCAEFVPRRYASPVRIEECAARHVEMSSIGLQSWIFPATRRRYAPVAIIVAISVSAFVVHAALALVQSSPWIFPDELIYAELAKGIAEHGTPSIRGSASWEYGPAYPFLISPAWLMDDGSASYVVVRLVNALVMALAVPLAYLVARRFVTARGALVVAAVTALMPSMLYVGTILTEVLLLPSFLLAVLAMCAALERPSFRNQMLVLAAIGLAALVKPLALVFVPAWVSTIVLDTLLSRDAPRRAALLRYRATGVVLAAGAAGAVVVSALGFSSPSDALGAYSVVLANVDVAEIPRWFVQHVAGLDLYGVVAPFAASLMVGALALRRDAAVELRRFGALVAPLTVLLLVAVAAYSSRPHGGAEGFFATSARLHERAIFFLAPLYFVGLALWLEHGSKRPRRFYVPLLSVAALLPAILPLVDLRENANFQAMSLVPWLTVDDVLPWPAGVLVVAGAAVLLLHRSVRVGSAFVWSYVAVWLVIVGIFTYGSFEASATSARHSSGAPTPTWVDDAIEAGDVVVVWVGDRSTTGSTERERQVWVNEFFNRSIGQVYWLGAPMTYALPSLAAELRAGTLYARGRAVEADFVLAPCPVEVSGTVVARGSNGLDLLRTEDGVVRATVGSPVDCPPPR